MSKPVLTEPLSSGWNLWAAFVQCGKGRQFCLLSKHYHRLIFLAQIKFLVTRVIKHYQLCQKFHFFGCFLLFFDSHWFAIYFNSNHRCLQCCSWKFWATSIDFIVIFWRENCTLTIYLREIKSLDRFILNKKFP